MQTLYTAAELSAAGLSAGPITAITYNITTLGDAATNASYYVMMGTTTLLSQLHIFGMVLQISLLKLAIWEQIVQTILLLITRQLLLTP
jgi:hypothetical protein